MSLFPQTRHPYYIVAPGYTRKSAGIRALYLLCHHLNVSGHAAYIVLRPWADLDACTELTADLLIPLLTPVILARHLDAGTLPITVYTDTIAGNPFSAPCVVRYYCNYPGLLGGSAVSQDELNFGFSQALAEAAGSPGNVLFIPSVDTRIFHPVEENALRRGTCYYAAKYKEQHYATTFDITRDSVEITRRSEDWPPERIARTFHASELFYIYENTMLAMEAILCGCPVVGLPNPYYTESISKAEVSHDGFAWGTAPEQIQHAKDTVHLGWDHYMQGLKLFPHHLADFIAKTQAYADETYGAQAPYR